MRANDAAKLARVLALLGSEHDGERASAALAAHRLMHRLGLTWQDVLMPKATPEPHAPPPPPDLLRAAESRLRQSQRENDDLRRQISTLRRRMEARIQQPERWDED
ncbi:hypothetical protein D9599_19665 [Roseomonas sp. KE2513]|uniref:hypothetical protein n=1 Tax=Roseomonas sp. KE2513 TaxID=2479202 RepID=UPI0018DFC193|nr:hypothetical protein [Roseomonas sp. KE2513]MBI0537780.1 hypothetical protein [Roseomonas sp. KE2513]